MGSTAGMGGAADLFATPLVVCRADRFGEQAGQHTADRHYLMAGALIPDHTPRFYQMP